VTAADDNRRYTVLCCPPPPIGIDGRVMIRVVCQSVCASARLEKFIVVIFQNQIDVILPTLGFEDGEFKVKVAM